MTAPAPRSGPVTVGDDTYTRDAEGVWWGGTEARPFSVPERFGAMLNALAAARDAAAWYHGAVLTAEGWHRHHIEAALRIAEAGATNADVAAKLRDILREMGSVADAPPVSPA